MSQVARGKIGWMRRGLGARMAMGSCAKYQRPCAHYTLWAGKAAKKSRAAFQGEVIVAVSFSRPWMGFPHPLFLTFT